MFDNRYPVPMRVVINGTPTDCEVNVEFDSLNRVHVLSLQIPHLESALRLLPDVQQAPSLDYVMNHWSRS